MVALTRNKDIDSLEASLLLTLVDFIPDSSITLYDCEFANDDSRTSMRLCVTANEGVIDLSATQHNDNFGQLTQRMKDTIESGLGMFIQSDEGLQEHWLAQTLGDGLYAILRLTVTKRLTKHELFLVQAFLKVYSNYATIIALSEKDKLTGLLNRHSLERRFQGLIASQLKTPHQHEEGSNKRQEVSTEQLWLGVIDIDHFKQVNDVYGHLCGDEVLLKLSQLMREWFRKTDLLFRFGGEEFLILLQPIKQDSAEKVFDNFRQWIAQQKFPLIGQVTLSIGVTAVTANEFLNNVVSRADKALYFAKEQGRNQVAVYEYLLRAGVFSEQSVTEGDIDLF
ncbi:GGDEF domain-containing protein [Alteromonas flava]|uniref:GGDEF domain-containing protein n=1 Tax=Alteromonas flava TaxID=2048003 RepID=UPI0013DD32AC|nr:GGDEF domain-containing protein [Alteromonas flava]